MFRLYPMILAAALGAGSPALTQTTTPALKAASGAEAIEKTTVTEDIRFRNEGYERMTVPVLLSGTGPYRFLVDTGADRTALSRELASHLKLEGGEEAELHSVTGTSMVPPAIVPSLQLTRKPVRIV